MAKNTKIHQKEYFLNFGRQTQTLRKHGFSRFIANIDQSLDTTAVIWKADIEGFPNNFSLKSQTLKYAEKFGLKISN